MRPKTHGQHRYIQAIRDNTVTFGIGPAGTGKTYLAMAAAVESLTAGAVRRIILTRPAVEAGERLGYLPGDLFAKIDPYLRPLYDALWDMLGPEETARLTERGTIEIAPLAYMRGRTLNDACVILDEAQNTSPEQMKMFLTRLGFNSKMIITGDVTQTDLPAQRPVRPRDGSTDPQGHPGRLFHRLDQQRRGSASNRRSDRRRLRPVRRGLSMRRLNVVRFFIFLATVVGAWGLLSLGGSENHRPGRRADRDPRLRGSLCQYGRGPGRDRRAPGRGGGRGGRRAAPGRQCRERRVQPAQ